MSFAAATFVLGSFVGSWGGGIQSELIGRKFSMMINNLIMLVGMLCIRFSHGLPLLFAGRFMTGYTNGANRSCTGPYTSEVCQPAIRKSTATFGVLLYTLGYTILYVLGVMLHWREILSFLAIFPVMFTIMLHFCPKSPTWLIGKGRVSEAMQNMLRLRGDVRVATLDVKRLQDNVKEQQRCQNKLGGGASYMQVLWSSFRQGPFVRPFCVLLIMLTVGMHWTGGVPLSFYLVPILQRSNVPMDPYWAAAIMSCYRLLFTIISTILSTFIPRRPLYIGCCVAAAVGSLLLGTSAYLNTYLQEYQLFQQQYPFAQWFPMLAIFLMYTGFSGGMGPVTFALFGEILPSNLRSMGTGLLSAIGFIDLFCVSKFTPNIESSMGFHGMFWLFSGFGFCVAIFAYLCVPETSGLTLEDIEEHYRKLCYGEHIKLNMEDSNLEAVAIDAEENVLHEPTNTNANEESKSLFHMVKCQKTQLKQTNRREEEV